MVPIPGAGQVEGDLYRPSAGGLFPGIVVCLGVVPFEVDHPQVPILGKALARAGFAALLYWSPAMRDFRLDPVDIENIALTYDWLIDQPYVDPARSGLLGTCVGGSFALMAAASPLIKDRIAYVSTYAPFSSMWTFAHDIASATRTNGERHEPWQVDPLTRKVFIHSLTSLLDLNEAEKIRNAFDNQDQHEDIHDLSIDGQAIYSLINARDEHEVNSALRHLPRIMQERLDIMSPMNYLKDIRVPLIIHLHDQGDQVIPVGESRRLHSALGTNAGEHYTEMQFSHLDPVKGKLPLFRLVREFGKFFLAVYPMFLKATA